MKKALRKEADIAEELAEGDFGNLGIDPIVHAIFSDRKNAPQDVMKDLKVKAQIYLNENPAAKK